MNPEVPRLLIVASGVLGAAAMATLALLCRNGTDPARAAFRRLFWVCSLSFLLSVALRLFASTWYWGGVVNLWLPALAAAATVHALRGGRS